EGEPKGEQLFVRWVDVDGPATQVTHVTEAPPSPRWSPDGKSIAFSMFVPEQNTINIDIPADPTGAKRPPSPRLVQCVHSRQDRFVFLEDGFPHLIVVQADGGTPRRRTNGKWSVGSREL